MPGMISVSLDSYMFLYKKGTNFIKLRGQVSLTNSSHLMFQSSVCYVVGFFFFFLVVVIYAKTPVYPGSSLTSLEQSLRTV